MSTATTVLTRCGTVAGRVASDRLPWLGRWCLRHRRWLALWLIVAAVTWLLGSAGTASLLLLVGIAPGLLAMAWGGLAPRSYEVLVARPSRRVAWWWFARVRWQRLARVCGLSDRQVVRTSRTAQGRPEEVTRWVAPRLRRVRTRAHSVELKIRARAGQTLPELETGAERLATTFGAVTHRVWPVSGATVVVELVMLDLLRSATTAQEPEPRALAESVRLGRTQAGRDWGLQLRGRHTLVVGCSGSGKGSVLWGICCGLSPAVRADVVRLWGIDLKRGVELAMGESLFSTRAYTPGDALAVLRALMQVIDERGRLMAGATRLHEPMVGDPLHVLVIDELAALTAYADLDIRREAARMLSEILTQGRALGVVVVACVQDPRKDVVAMRGLFTQTIALRLRSVEETVMVLGDGMSHLAPAHRISPTYPGTGWVVDDTGAADRVRADYWPDPLIRELSRRYATEVPIDISTSSSEDTVERTDPVEEQVRKPRSPRKSRTARSPREPPQAPGTEQNRQDNAVREERAA
jgi:S-DNA-T family DNA segregation ATPase FtsK/SpoIIIE